MSDIDNSKEDEEMEEGEASDSDEDVEVNVTLPTNKAAVLNNNGIPYGPDPISKQPSFCGFPSYAEEKPGKFSEDPISIHNLPSPLSVKNLYNSLGLNHGDFIGGDYRSDTLHVWSAEKLDHTAVSAYFRHYHPSSIHWTNSNECNVHWRQDNNMPIRALLGLSCSIQYSDDPPSVSKSTHLSPSPPRPPTRRHNTPQEALGETSDKNETQSKKKSKKKKSKKSDSSDSSDSSSSDSDDSSSSSSDSSSSDSDSSDESDSDSSSDSGSSSSSSDSDSSNSEKTKEKKRKKLAKTANNNSEDMEVDDVNKKIEGPAMKANVDLSDEKVGVRLSDIPAGCPLPKGRWRLGVPCPKTRALLLRFANKEDIDKAYQMERRLQAQAEEEEDRKEAVWTAFDQEKRHRKKKRRRESDEEEEGEEKEIRTHRVSGEERRHRRARRAHEAGIKSRLSGPKLGLPAMRPPGGALPLYHPPRPEAFLPPLPLVAERTYRDLDDPMVEPEEAKNPWGNLAQNWGKKETAPGFDYQALLKNHRKANKGQKRQRDPDEDSGYDGQRQYRRDGGFSRHAHDDQRRVGDHHRYADSGGDDRQRSEEEDDVSSESDTSDDIVAWNTKMRLPRMKMYADVEEKRRKVKSKRNKPPTDGAQWNPRGRDAVEKSSRKPKSIFSRLGRGDGPPRRVPADNFREREFVPSMERDWGPERPSKRSRVGGSVERGGAGGMRSEIHVPRNIKARLGGGRRF